MHENKILHRTELLLILMAENIFDVLKNSVSETFIRLIEIRQQFIALTMQSIY